MFTQLGVAGGAAPMCHDVDSQSLFPPPLSVKTVAVTEMLSPELTVTARFDAAEVAGRGVTG